MSMETLHERQPSLWTRSLDGLRRAIDSYRPVQHQTVLLLSQVAGQVAARGGLLLVDEPHRGIMIIDTDPAAPKTTPFKRMFYQEIEDRFGETTQTTEWGVTRGGAYESRVASVRNGIDGLPTSRRWTENQAQAMIDMAHARLAEAIPMPPVSQE